MSETMFRIKKTRESKTDNIGGTLDSVHQSMINSFKEVTKPEPPAEITFEKDPDILKIARAYRESQSLKTEENEDCIQTYFLKNADIMLQYYSHTDNSQTISKTPGDVNTFLKYLKPLEKTEGLSKKQIFDEYLSRMKLLNNADGLQNNDSEHCSRCNVAREEVSSEGILVCPSCGSEEYMMVVSDFTSFRDPPKERNNYAYKKINHLNEILNQFQAKESTIIPDEVMNEVVFELKKRRVQNVADMTEKDIREILKKINRSKYYEHAAHIVSRLNGNPPPTITPEIEEKIRTMFQEIQSPFLLYCPNDRTNFLSYSYILYKFFELLELDEYKVYFPLLKSRDRLISHDQIWKKICDYLKWEFVTSI
jgi:uncharacterized Zn finger protein (UPF0148 family)